jgi:general transcription factor 3C polypeptide 3 (transcription factor C subunit 4)
VLGELRPVLIELSDLPTCATLYQNAFDYYQAAYPKGHATDRETGAEIPGAGFGLMEILVLTDLYNTLHEYDRAMVTIRRGCRWLQGRSEQRYWDVCDDDREYDVIPNGRDMSGRDGEVQPGMFPLELNARHRLAIARIRIWALEEGKVCDNQAHIAGCQC